MPLTPMLDVARGLDTRIRRNNERKANLEVSRFKIDVHTSGVSLKAQND